MACFPVVDSPASIGPLYILYFATSNHSFRLPDFLAAAEYLQIPFAFVPTPAKPILEQARKDHGIVSETCTSSYRPDLRRPFALAHLPSDEAAVRLLQRCVSLRSIWAYWSHGDTYAQLHATNQSEHSRGLWSPYVDTDVCPSWKAHVFSFSYTISDKRKVDVIQSFSYMDFKGRIQLKEPAMRWGVMEEYIPIETWPGRARDTLSNHPGGVATDGSDMPELGDRDPRLVQIFAGRRIDAKRAPVHQAGASAIRKYSDPSQEGQVGLARSLIEKLNLKKRVYIGNTSMESEMSLLMASMALAGPGKIIYDPFAGTGSMLYASAVFGAMAVGSDIDGRPMRGKANLKNTQLRTGIVESATQYGVQDRILDAMVFDMTQPPWRRNLLDSLESTASSSSRGIVDGIVADPPYGVRAGAKRLGKRDPEKQRMDPFWMPDGLGADQGCWSHERSDYVPPTRPYHLEDLVNDLMDYAYTLLPDGGRLVFWLPSMIDHEEDDGAATTEGPANSEGRSTATASHQRSVSIDLPQHKRGAGQGRMRMIHYSLQDFGRWGRWLITMEKVSAEHDVDDEGLRELEERLGELGKNKDERGIYRADRDPLEFRNRYYLSSKATNSQSRAR